MIRSIRADSLFPIASPPIRDGVLTFVEETGTVLSLGSYQQGMPDVDTYFPGILIPGFINAHCHLELSHLAGEIPSGTGLLSFLQAVVRLREFSADLIRSALEAQDKAMWDVGIMAVGDISNKLDTAECKRNSRLRYATFVEFFDFLQPTLMARSVAQYRDVFGAFQPKPGDTLSAVPHAPYSVSEDLFREIDSLNPPDAVVSIHNQETIHEDLLFRNGGGDFPSFFRDFGLDFSAFKPTGKASLYYALQYLNPSRKNLFVHNTLTGAEELASVAAWTRGGAWWVTCPNANLYIENRLPDYRLFLDAKANVCLGTDSLSSNWTLSILDELKTLSRFCSWIPPETLLKWATLNGAEALGMAQTLGSLEPGKTPGILQLYPVSTSGHFLPETRVRRIA